MNFPKVKFEPTFTIGNIITLALLSFAAIGGWFDMRGSIREVAQTTAAAQKELAQSTAVAHKALEKELQGDIKEVSQQSVAADKELGFRIDAESQTTSSTLKQQDLRAESSKAERIIQIQMHEQRILTVEKAIGDLAQFTRATGELQIEIRHLREAVQELKNEMRVNANLNRMPK